MKTLQNGHTLDLLGKKAANFSCVIKGHHVSITNLKSCWWRLIISAGAPPIAHQVQSITPRNLVGGRLLRKQVFQETQK